MYMNLRLSKSIGSTKESKSNSRVDTNSVLLLVTISPGKSNCSPEVAPYLSLNSTKTESVVPAFFHPLVVTLTVINVGPVGLPVGTFDGIMVGVGDGISVGLELGLSVGDIIGDAVGLSVGRAVGTGVGESVGPVEGLREGLRVGFTVGCGVATVGVGVANGGAVKSAKVNWLHFEREPKPVSVMDLIPTLY